MLLHLEKWNHKYCDEDIEKESAKKQIGPARENLFKDFNRSNYMVMQSKSLTRQGLISAKGWDLTPKGKAMCEVIRCEIKEAGNFF